MPLAVCRRTTGRTGYARAPLVAAVVEMMSVTVPGVSGAIFTELAGLKLNVGRSWAPAGLEVIVAISVTLPVKSLTDVTVMVEVFPVVAPGLTDTGVPAIVKSATVTELVPLAAL